MSIIWIDIVKFKDRLVACQLRHEGRLLQQTGSTMSFYRLDVMVHCVSKGSKRRKRIRNANM